MVSLLYSNCTRGKRHTCLKSFMSGALRLGFGSSKNVLKETVLQLSPSLPVFPRPLDFTCFFLLKVFSAFLCFLLSSLAGLSLPLYWCMSVKKVQ